MIDDESPKLGCSNTKETSLKCLTFTTITLLETSKRLERETRERLKTRERFERNLRKMKQWLMA